MGGPPPCSPLAQAAPLPSSLARLSLTPALPPHCPSSCLSRALLPQSTLSMAWSLVLALAAFCMVAVPLTSVWPHQLTLRALPRCPSPCSAPTSPWAPLAQALP